MYKIGDKVRSPLGKCVGTIEYFGYNDMMWVRWKHFNCVNFWTTHTVFEIITEEEFLAHKKED